MDICIKNGKLRGRDELWSIGVENGRIAKIAPTIEGDAKQTIDAEGNLVTESFVNGHLHLCKVYTKGMAGDTAVTAYTTGTMGNAMTAIEEAARIKEQYDESWILPNVRKALNLAVKYGNTHIRAFVDTDTTGKLEGMKAVLKAKEEYKDRIELQVVAFPQDGVIRDPGAEDYVRQAIEMGADVVGGIPWIEYTDKDSQAHIDKMFAIAKEFDKDVSMLIDDAGDANLRTLEMLAVKTIEAGWNGRVTAQHARAMALYSEPYYRKIEALLKKAQIGVVSDPQTGPLYARVRDLYSAGIGIALGQDDIADAYYAFGRNNMLEVAFLAAHLMWMTTFEDMEILYDLITTRAAIALGMKNFALTEGNEANLLILNADSVWEAIWHHEAPKAVIKAGIIISS